MPDPNVSRLQRFILNGLSIQIGKCDLFPSIIVEPHPEPWPKSKVDFPLQAILFCPFLTCRQYTTCEPQGISVVGVYRYRGDPAPDDQLLKLLKELADVTETNLPAVARAKVNSEVIVLANEAGEQKLIDQLEGLGATKAAD